MDASLDGPDATFVMLLYYLKKLGVAVADQLLFVSDGAVWMWGRIASLITNLGIELKQCLLVLDSIMQLSILRVLQPKKSGLNQMQKSGLINSVGL